MAFAPPVVSILVTVYNRENYLKATLESVRSSIYRDFEVIIVDDCSSDSSAEIARPYPEIDERFKFEQNPKNLGDYGNRMRAASLARGKFLKYLDSDDLIYPHSLQVFVDAMERFPDAALALSHSLPEDDEPYPWKLEPTNAFRKHFLGRGCFGCGPSGAIIRRKAFEAANGFRKEWGVLSDCELWLRLAQSHPTVLVPPGLVWWRRHEGQEYSSGNATAVYLEQGYWLDIEYLKQPECPLDTHDRKIALRRIRHRHARRLLSLAVISGKWTTAWKTYRRSGLSIRELCSGFRKYRLHNR